MVRWSSIRVLVLAIPALFLVPGCGGSGSSGFDAGNGSSGFDNAFAVEQETIDQVNQEGGCLDADGALICAPDTANGHTPAAEFLVIDPSSGSEVPCLEIPELEQCTFVVRIEQLAFPEGTQFYSAVRFQDDSSSWSSGLSPFEPDAQDPARQELTIRVQGLTAGKMAVVQVAVLVFYPGTDLPPPSPGDLLLRDFGADRVYVVTDVSVVGTSGS